MTGIRIGYLISSRAMTKSLLTQQHVTVMYPSSIGQQLVRLVFESGSFEKINGLIVGAVSTRMSLLYHALRSNPIFEVEKPAGGLYLWPRLVEHDDMKMFQTLLEMRVGVMPGRIFDNKLKWTRNVRIAVSADEPQVRDACAVFAKVS